MKYKDIQVGEWFRYHSHTLIKTYNPKRGCFDNYVMESNLGFGECWGELSSEAEVSYIPYDKIDYPFMWEREETFENAGLNVPFRCGDTTFIKDVYRDKTLTCMIATIDPNVDCLGVWMDFDKTLPVRYTNQFEYKTYELLLTNATACAIL